MKPFHDLAWTRSAMRNTGGTDHLSFDAAGIPGFQFHTGPAGYDTRTHHSNMDVYDRLQPEDLKQMAVIVASFVYMAAQREQMFPRKPLEKNNATSSTGIQTVEGNEAKKARSAGRAFVLPARVSYGDDRHSYGARFVLPSYSALTPLG